MQSRSAAIASVRPGPSTDAETLLAHVEWVRALAHRLVRDPEVADDATQDTFVDALRHGTRRALTNPRAFLAAVLRNRLRQNARGTARRTRHENVAAATAVDRIAEDTSEAAARAELHQTLVREVLALPDPDRAVVLLHHFDGLSTRAVADRLGLTDDAVRARLRRARAALRTRLDRAYGDRRAWIGPFVAATPSVGWTGPTVTVLAKGKLVVATALAATAVVTTTLWFASSGSPPPSTTPTDPAGPIATATDARADRPQPIGAEPSATAPTIRADANRTEVATGRGTHVVDGRLVGLHARAEWTAPLSIDLDARLEDGTSRSFRAAVDVVADGAFATELPAWLDRATDVDARLHADDPNYLVVDERPDAAALLAHRPFELRVTPAAIVRGRVVDAVDREPIAGARAVTYRIDASGEGGVETARANTALDGTFTLRTPVEGRLLLAAVPMQVMALSGAVIRQNDGGVTDLGKPRLDRLPLGVGLDVRVGEPTDVGELGLPATAPVDITVTWPDGRPAAGATAQAAQLDWDLRLPLADRFDVVGWRAGAADVALCVMQHGRRTDAEGRLRAASIPGREVYATVTAIDGHAIAHFHQDVGELVVAPARVELTLPNRAITIGVRGPGGRPEPDVRVTIVHPDAGASSTHTDADGEARVVLPPPGTTVRGTLRKDGLGEHRFELGGDEPHDRRDFDLTRLDTVAVRVRIVGDVPVERARFSWRSTERDDSGHSALVSASAEDGAFALRMAPGEHLLSVLSTRDADAAAGPFDGFVLTATRRVTVGTRGGDLPPIDVAHGGRVELTVTRADGERVGGRSTLVDATTGAELRHGFLQIEPDARRHPYEPDGFTATGTNRILPVLHPGEYRLRLRPDGHGATIDHRVTIRARETTRVDLRIP